MWSSARVISGIPGGCVLAATILAETTHAHEHNRFERLSEGSGSHSPPTIRRASCPQERVAQLPQFSVLRTLIESGHDVFGGASDLVNAVTKVGSVVCGQNHSVGRQPDSRPARQLGALFIGALTARLATVLAPTPHASVGDVPTAPAARLGMGPSTHAADFSRADLG